MVKVMNDKFIYSEIYSHPSNICLNLTDDCNLACRYCFVTQKPNYMTLEVAKDAVKWAIDNLHWNKERKRVGQKDKLLITYFGGEPTLMWDQIIVPLTNWCKENYNDEVKFCITTNGTLLNEERIKFLYDNDIYPLLSIDGAPETQNYNRPCKNPNLKSADLQYKNIPILLKYFPEMTFRSTIDESTVEHTFENYIFAQYMGFKNIFMMPNCRNKWKQEKLDILKQQFQDIYTYITWYFEHNQFPPINFSCINDSFIRIKKHNTNILNNYTDQGQKRELHRCGLGTGNCAIGYDGTIYACQEQNSKEQNSYFVIGDIYNGIDINKHRQFLNEYYNSVMSCGDDPTYCVNCPLNNICEDLHCPSSCHDLFKDFGKDSYVHCFWQRAMYEQAIGVLQYLDENKTFRQYLEQYCHYNFLKTGD